MKIADIANLLEADILIRGTGLETEIVSACGSDLMSDVMAFGHENAMLLTGLINPQVIRTAEMIDALAVVFVRGKKPDEAILTLAKEKDIAVLATNLPLFTACGILYAHGLPGSR